MQSMLLAKLLSDPKNVLLRTTGVEKPSPCPYCKTEVNMVSSTDDAEPERGHIVICFECAGLCQFGPSMALVAVSLDELDVDEETRERVREAISLVKRTTRLVHVKGSEGEA